MDSPSVPEVVVDRVKGPDATLTVSPPVPGPVIVLAPVPEKVTLSPRVVAPVVLRVVKAPVEGVVAPIAVELMPVPVTLNLLEVTVSALAPKSKADAAAPVRFSAPDPVMVLVVMATVPPTTNEVPK